MREKILSKVKLVLWLLPFLYFCFLMSTVVFLAMISIWSLANVGLIKTGQLLIFLVTIKVLLPFYRSFRVKGGWLDLAVIVPALVLVVSRFPFYYPLYDDLAYHLMAGDYGLTMWRNGNFLSMGFATYIYPLAQMVYRPFLDLLGIRLTLLLNSIVLLCWFFSLNLRFKSLVGKNKPKRLLLDLVFLYIYFTPHLMATHVSFMVDFVTLILVLEMLLGMLSVKRNKTLAVVMGMLAMIIKQSSGLVVMPVFVYLVWRKRNKINWRVVFGVLFMISVYFVVNYKNTGNPIAFLYNGFFKSSLYPLANFKDTRWGPQSNWEVIIWPVVGQFTQRFGEGIVSKYAKIFFSFFMIVPYLGSIILWFKTKKLKYVLIVFSYLLWSVLMGYSRYHVAFSALVLIWMVSDFNFRSIKFRLSEKVYFVVLAIFSCFCLISVSVDYGWRPNLLQLKNKFGFEYFMPKWKTGISWLLKDRVVDLAKNHEDLYDGYDVVMPYFRGHSTFVAYLGYLNGLKVVDAVSIEDYEKIMIDKKISNQIKDALGELDKAKRVLFVIDRNFGVPNDNLLISRNFDCFKNDYEFKSSYFQLDDYFSGVDLYECVRSEG